MDPGCLKVLYSALNSNPSCSWIWFVIWNPKTVRLDDKMEKVERRFLFLTFYIAFKLHMGAVSEFISLKSVVILYTSLISTRCPDYNDVLFLYKLFNGKVVCPEFLNKINFYVPNPDDEPEPCSGILDGRGWFFFK